MAAFGPEVSSQVQAATNANLGEISASFARTFGGQFEIPADSIAVVDGSTLPPEFEGPGLVCAFKINDGGALLFAPDAAGLFPPWYVKPDPSGSNKLNSLAMEIGFVMFPEEFKPSDSQGAYVEDFYGGIQQAEISFPPELTILTFVLQAGDKSVPVWLLWPAKKPYEVFSKPDAPSDFAFESNANGEINFANLATDAPATKTPAESTDAKPSSPAESPDPTAPKRLNYRSLEDGLRLLPGYSRSLLKIKVPVVVKLAAIKQPVSKILEIVPGSMIQFNKSCDEMLSVEVGNQQIAIGEAVKVGDKFGLRITEMTLPDERFLSVRGKRGE